MREPPRLSGEPLRAVAEVRERGYATVFGEREAEVNAIVTDFIKPTNRSLGRFLPTDAPERAPFLQRVPAEEALKDFKPREAVSAGENFDSSPANLDKRSEVFTPQVVVNGRADVVGSNRGELEAVIDRERNRSDMPSIEFANGAIQLGAGPRDANAEVWLVRYDPRCGR